MSAALAFKLLAIGLTVALGYGAARLRWLGDGALGAFSSAAFYIFIPALLFRTTARIDITSLPLGLLAAFFVPVGLVMVGVYLWQRHRHQLIGPQVAVPAVRSFAVGFGNTVQLGIPLTLALFGEPGMGLLLTLVSLHALVLLSLCTVRVEADLAAERRRVGAGGQGWDAVRQTLWNALVHPVVTPVLLGLAFNTSGLGMPAWLDEWLALLGQAVVPVCLLVIGLSLAQYGLRGHVRAALWVSAGKLLAVPAAVLAVAWGVFGLRGLPLQVLVMTASLPVGSNPLIFAQRYRTLEAETTAACVLSTMLFALTAPLWLALVQALGRL